MKKPGLVWCLATAFVGAICVGGVESLFWPWLGGSSTMRLLAALLPLGYCAVLLALAEAKVGRIVLAAFTVAVSGAVFFGPFGLNSVVAAGVGLVWVVRSLCFQRSVVGALLDGVVAALGVATAMLAFSSTRSLATAAWSALLVQSAFVFIPDAWGGRGSPTANPPESEAFARAYRAADDALRDLAAR